MCQDSQEFEIFISESQRWISIRNFGRQSFLTNLLKSHHLKNAEPKRWAPGSANWAQLTVVLRFVSKGSSAWALGADSQHGSWWMMHVGWELCCGFWPCPHSFLQYAQFVWLEHPGAWNWILRGRTPKIKLSKREEEAVRSGTWSLTITKFSFC